MKGNKNEEKIEKIKRIEELRYEISKRTIDLNKITIAKEYDKEKEKIKELRKEFDKIYNEIGNYIFFNKEIINSLKEKFMKIPENERRKAIDSELVKKTNDLLKKNYENREKIAKLIVDIENLNEFNEFKDLFEGRKESIKVKGKKIMDINNLKEICKEYDFSFNQNIFGEIEIKKIKEELSSEKKIELNIKKMLDAFPLPFFKKEDKEVKEINEKIKEIDKKIKEILNDEGMKRYTLGIFKNDEEKKKYDEKQKELLELIKEKRKLETYLNSMRSSKL